MLKSTPMLCNEHSNGARACQRPIMAVGNVPAPPSASIAAYARTGPVDVGRVIDAVARAYTEARPMAAVEVAPATVLGKGRQSDITQAHHVCPYLLVEDHHLTNLATARARGRSDHSTTINSRAQIATALGHDATLATTLTRAWATLAGTTSATLARPELDRDRPRTFEAATPAELAEYRYWRLRALRADTIQNGSYVPSDALRGAATGCAVRS